jgi:hypothetical protein
MTRLVVRETSCLAGGATNQAAGDLSHVFVLKPGR